MDREKSFIKNSLILSLGTVVPKLMSIITLPIITACLTKTEYGTYDLILTLVALVLPIATLQMQASAFRFLVAARADKDSQKAIITNIIAFTVPACIIALALIAIFFDTSLGEHKLLILGYFFVDILVITARQMARGLNQNHVYSISVLVNASIELLLVALLLLGFGRALDGVLIALIVSLSASLIYIIWSAKLFRYWDASKISVQKIRELIRYSWPLIPNALSSWIIKMSNRLVLTYFMGLEATAIYGVANKIPNMFNIIQSTFSLAWQENASLSVEDSDASEYYGKMFSKIFDLMIGLMALLIASTPVVFPILVHGDYDESYNHMLILYIGVLFSMISAYLGGIYIAHMKSKEIGITTTMVAIVNLVLNIFFVDSLGIYAASLSSVLCYLWLSFYRMWDIQKIQKIQFDYRRIVMLIGILCIMSMLCAQRIWWLDILNVSAAIVLFVRLNKNLICYIANKVRSKRG